MLLGGRLSRLRDVLGSEVGGRRAGALSGAGGSARRPALQIRPKFEPRAGQIALWVVCPGSDSQGISLGILFDATTEILVAAAAHGTFNLHRVVLIHDVKPFSQAA
jgi:hypothetical protein